MKILILFSLLFLSGSTSPDPWNREFIFSAPGRSAEVITIYPEEGGGLIGIGENSLILIGDKIIIANGFDVWAADIYFEGEEIVAEIHERMYIDRSVGGDL